jgi:hypothetical protein
VAIDQGNNTEAANAGLTTDFEGDNRIIGVTVDMGADEATCSLDGDDDGDGVCNAMDVCPTGDDNVDANNNGNPDACDTACPGGAIGDVNTDGFVNAGDVAAFAAVLLDPDSATANEWCAADVNLDGQVDGEDIQGIVSLILTP